MTYKRRRLIIPLFKTSITFHSLTRMATMIIEDSLVRWYWRNLVRSIQTEEIEDRGFPHGVAWCGATVAPLESLNCVRRICLFQDIGHHISNGVYSYTVKAVVFLKGALRVIVLDCITMIFDCRKFFLRNYSEYSKELVANPSLVDYLHPSTPLSFLVSKDLAKFKVRVG